MAIPEKIKIGDKEYTVKDNPELLTLVQEARKEEKDKLYTQISALEASKKVLEDEKAAGGTLTAEKEKELVKLREEIGATKAQVAEKDKEIEKIKKAKKSAASDDDDDDDEDGDKKSKKGTKQVKESGMSKEEVAELLKQQQEAADKKLAEALEKVNGKMSQKDVDAYREKQIKKYVDDGVLIEDLVPANLTSEAEVNAAIQKGLEKSKKYLMKEYKSPDGKTTTKVTLEEYEEKVKADEAAKAGGQGSNNGGAGGTTTYTPPSAADKPDAGNSDYTDQELLSKVKDMTPEEYEKNRDRIMKQMKQVKYVGSGDEGDDE